MNKTLWTLCLACFMAWEASAVHAGVSGSIEGTVQNPQGAPLAGAWVSLTGGGVSLSATCTAGGGFSLYDLPIGDYSVRAASTGYTTFTEGIHLSSDATLRLDLRLNPVSGAAETADEVLAPVTIQSTRIRINPSASVSSQEINQNQIAQLPGGATQSLPKVLYQTNPGFVEGSFGQVFARGNHANIQYDIDGVQLPDDAAGTFGDAFSVLDIDKMEVISGGMPAEYGDRLSSVVNIVTKAGQAPGGYLDMNYGSFNTFSPQAAYGGSADGGKLNYFFSGSYTSTERGLDTPEPSTKGSAIDQNQGGTAAVHDYSTANNQFGKVDYSPDAQDTLMFTAFNAQKLYQIPNYPSNFLPDAGNPANFFDPDYSDEFGNVGGAIWTPTSTNDYQMEGSDYASLQWKHRFENDSVMQITPYVKFSSVIFNGDPSNDLQAASAGTDGDPVTADSFSEDRVTTNLGLQGDYTLHLNQANTAKSGFQLQSAEAHGPISIEYLTTGESVSSTATDGSDHDYQESAYVQDDIQIVKHVVLNAGLRYDAIQYLFSDGTRSLDDMFQPRLGLNYTPWDETKFHLYYGELFQPAPAEDLRDSFSQVNGTLEPYDIKSEKDQYYEAGVTQQLGPQLVSVNTYYKSAVNLLDDTQLLNTAITEPYNYTQGFVYGTELSINGKFLKHFSDFLTYSYEIAQGYGASGGLFALSSSDLQQALTGGDNFWQYLDHCQMNTANAGLTWNLGGFTVGATGLYGSGLRTGYDNEVSLPAHFTMDGTLSYALTGSRWLEDVKVALDVTNVFDNVYPIFVDNGFNGSHYVAPTEYMVHVIKAL